MNAKIENKLFEIEDFSLEESTIEVTAVKGEQEKTISVPRERFEKWMQNTDRLESIYDYADYSGEHVQEVNSISIEDYWDDIMIEKKNDLYEFIILKMTDCRKIFDLPLTSILIQNKFRSLQNSSL